MGVNVKRHAPAALPPLERTLVPIEYEAEWAPQVCLDNLEREESQSPGSSSPQSTLLHPLGYSGSN